MLTILIHKTNAFFVSRHTLIKRNARKQFFFLLVATSCFPRCIILFAFSVSEASASSYCQNCDNDHGQPVVLAGGSCVLSKLQILLSVTQATHASKRNRRVWPLFSTRTRSSLSTTDQKATKWKDSRLKVFQQIITLWAPRRACIFFFES